MSTNPSNAIGTNGAYGGRTSVNAFNDVLGAFTSRGIISGWAASPDSGLDITIGGDGSTRDVAVAEDNIGNKTTINNISEDPVSITIPAAPATNSRIDLVVAYVDNPAQGSSTETDNPGACGLIVVSGTAASTPSDPTDADIRTAITADGGAGTIAYYVILAKVKIASSTTDITANMITQGANAGVGTNNIANSAVTTVKLADNAVTPAKLDLGKMYYGLTVNGEFQATSLVSKGTLTVPAGTYLVGVNGHVGTGGASDTNYSAGIYAMPGSLSGTAVANASYYFWQGSGVIQDIGVDLANMRKVTFSSQTTLYLGVSSSGNLKNFSQVAMWAIRIA